MLLLYRALESSHNSVISLFLSEAMSDTFMTLTDFQIMEKILEKINEARLLRVVV